MLKQLTNITLSAYLDLMADTETPPLFHAWSLVSAASACLGRRCWFQMGAVRIMPNQYIMLVGSPAVKKSTAISFARKLVDEIEGLRFAPNNTAGRMQGLLSRMANEADDNLELQLTDFAIESIVDDLNKHALYVMEGELATFIGVKSTDFITFLTDMWDKSGEPSYQYQLKNSAMCVPNPCLNLIGAITPMHISTYFPAEAIGQGFMSRVIMVYSDEVKKVAWPEPLDEAKTQEFSSVLQEIFETYGGEFKYTAEAKQAVIALHSKGYGAIEDARFIHYMQRRQTHTIKVAMALAALRLSDTVDASDIHDADKLLKTTEKRMAESLGEYGLSPVSLAKSRIGAVLRASLEPLTTPRLCLACGGDLRPSDVQQALYELVEQSLIIELVVRDAHGNTRTAYITPKTLVNRDANSHVQVSYMLREPRASKVDVLLAQAPSSGPLEQSPSQDDLNALKSLIR